MENESFELTVSVPLYKGDTLRKVTAAIRKLVGRAYHNSGCAFGFRDLEFNFRSKDEAEAAMARVVWERPDANVSLTRWTIDIDAWPEDAEIPTNAAEILSSYVGSPTPDDMIVEIDGKSIPDRLGNA